MHRHRAAGLTAILIGLAVSAFSVLSIGYAEYLWLICCEQADESRTSHFIFIFLGVALVGIIIAGAGAYLQYYARSSDM